MVQLVVLIQFYLFCLCSFFFNCSGKLFSSPTKRFFRDLIVRRSEFASFSETSQFRKMSANSKQWLNGYEFSSHNCGGTVLYYYSSSFGSCEQKMIHHPTSFPKYFCPTETGATRIQSIILTANAVAHHRKS